MNYDYLRVSALMFLEFAIWGAWMPVLALRLLGPMKLNGKQTGWIYATFPLASIFSPIVAGYLADKYFNAEHVILVCHALGAILLFVAAKQTKFWGMFSAMFAYSIVYTASIPLITTVLYGNPGAAALDTWVWFWAPVSWALVGYFLTGLRQVRRVGGDGPDSLYLAAILSLAMVAACLIQMPTKPAGLANPMAEALGMFKNTNYLVFMLIQLAVIGMQQFYFIGTGQFLQDRGVSGKNVSAVMALAQAVQAAATILLLGWLLGLPKAHGYGELDGYQLTFIVGALCWTVLFAVYIITKHTIVLGLFQAFHGLAYVFFVIGGQIFVKTMAPQDVRACALSLLAIATNGIGLFLGTQLTGFVMQKNSVGGKFQWPKIWAVPLVITLAGAIVFAAAFRVPDPKDFQKEKPKNEKAAAVATR
jgi:MFS family permease